MPLSKTEQKLVAEMKRRFGTKRKRKAKTKGKQSK